MDIDAEGWLPGIRRVRSPNFDARPANSEVELVVLHCISLPRGCFGTGDVEDLFLNALDFDRHPSYESLKGLRVSAHVFIERNGRPVQFVSFLDRAWHAGVSVFRGREACNDFSIGIELEGTEDGGYESGQYSTLEDLLKCLQRRWPRINPQTVVGHSDVAVGRKVDPGSYLDWQRVRKFLEKYPRASAKN